MFGPKIDQLVDRGYPSTEYLPNPCITRTNFRAGVIVLTLLSHAY